jgi:hypothetical protein
MQEETVEKSRALFVTPNTLSPNLLTLSMRQTATLPYQPDDRWAFQPAQVGAFQRV